MNGSFRVGTLFGIPFYVNVSWFLILGLMTLNYGNFLAAQFPALGTNTSWLLGLVTALSLFASVVAHELGHSIVAIRQGIDVKSITLFLFGGLANLDKESKTPGEAFWIAIAGPLVSLVLFAVLSAIIVTTPISGPLAAILSLLASINLALALFNLIPGLPLDGGNILKALVWKITGNPYKGIFFASRVGQVLGWLWIVSALIPLALGREFSLWNLLIGWFLLQNAGSSAQYATIQDKLAGLKAVDAVASDSPVISQDISLREFANNYVIGQTKWRRFLGVDGDKHLVGSIDVDDIKTIPTSQWSEVPVKQLLKPVDQTKLIKFDKSLLEVVTLLEQYQLTELPVIGENGALLGLLEKSAIIQLLQPKSA